MSLATLLIVSILQGDALARQPRGAEPVDVGVSVLRRVLPSVVLIVADNADGTTGYGAGVLAGGDGLVLTNLHVVASATALRVLRYDPDRPSYAPMDGGLPRVLFEAERDLEAARLVRGDPLTDLAVLQVPGGGGPALPLRRSPAAPGEPIFAIGHPQESTWTFTAGVVSALRQGVIQHDAPISPGSSGGPLVDARGRLLGINTLRLAGSAEGIAFARPAALALALVGEAGAPVEIDLSRPDRASLSCVHALELAPGAADVCMHWADGEEIARRAADVAADLLSLSPGERGALRAAVRERTPLIAAELHRSISAHFAASDDPPARTEIPPLPLLWADEDARAAHLEAVGAEQRLRLALQEHRAWKAGRGAWLEQNNGLKTDLTTDSKGYQEVRKLGARVDAVWYLAEDQAWVGVVGRNLDGTAYHDAECWSRFNGVWEQRLLCTDQHHSGLPEGWPEPAYDDRAVVTGLGLRLALQASGWRDTDLLPQPDKAPEARG